MAACPASLRPTLLDTRKPPFRRPRDLAQLIGVPDREAQDYSVSGRLSLIEKLQAARRTEIARGQSGSWLYDAPRHLRLCAALRAECEALAALLARQDKAVLEAAIGAAFKAAA